MTGDRVRGRDVDGPSRSAADDDRRIQAVLFDLDGTLFDHEGAVVSALRTWLPTLGAEVDDPLIERWFAAEEEHTRQWRLGRISWEEQRRRRLREVLPEHVPRSDAGTDRLFASYVRHYKRAWVAFDDVPDALERLRRQGLRLAVLTNGSTEQQIDKLRAIGLRDRFEFVLTAEDLGAGKPDPAVYLAACDRLRLPTAAVAHVGDVPSLDVRAAHASGLRAVLIDRSGRYRDPAALRHLGDLVAWVDAAGTTPA